MSNMKQHPLTFNPVAIGCLLAAFLTLNLPAQSADQAILEERRQLLELVETDPAQAIGPLQDALNSESDLVRRTAAHLLARTGDVEAIARALENDHPEVRRIAIGALAKHDALADYWNLILLDEESAIQRDVRLVWVEEFPLPEGEDLETLVAEFTQTYQEAEPPQRRHVIALLAGFDEFNDPMRELLLEATTDDDSSVRLTAYETLYEYAERDWPEAADLVAAARSDESEDVRDVGTQLRWKFLQVKPFRFPAEGWRFQLDPSDTGRESGWYAVDFDDSAWLDDGVIETHWHNFLDEHYIGAGWYRMEFDLPEFDDWNEAYLDFGGVDEGAWVWVNGEFVGEHDIGREGWDQPFLLEVAEAIKPGETNQITVRARNTAGGGGIWRPIHLRVINTSLLD